MNEWHVRGTTRRDTSTEISSSFEIVPGELRKNFDWTQYLLGVEVVVHCAARVHITKEYLNNPLQKFREVNVDGTLSLARQAAKCGVRRFVFLSTIGVHGVQTTGRPFHHKDIMAPNSDYAVSKFEAEQALFKLAEESGMELVVIRPPLVYGPGAPGNFAMLLKILHSGVPLPLASVTDNKRSLIFIDNLLSLIKCCLDHPAAANQIFLASDNEALSTVTLLRQIGVAIGRPARLFHAPVFFLRTLAFLLGKKMIAQRLCGSLEVDIEKTKELLGWEPKINIKVALQQTAAYWLEAKDR
jgi:nucleoside-diphosphate-sugar epimerase